MISPTLRSVVSSVLFFSLAFCQCGSTLQKKVETVPVWQQGDAYIRLFQEKGDPKGYDQPWTVYEKEMRGILLSLYFSRYEYFRWSTSSRVFEEDRVNTLAPFFQRAFLAAGPDDVVEFYLPFRTSKLFGLTGETVLTRGWAFVKDHQLNFQFFNMQEPMTGNCPECDESDDQPSIAWKFVPQPGQGYGEEKNILGSDRQDPHWIVMDLASPAQAATPVPAKPTVRTGPDKAPPAAAGPAAGEREVEDRFEELKNLLDKGLITEKDYEQKKKELLDSL
jgi:hypothetical protein